MQNVAAMQCIRMENVLRRKVADQEQQMADQAQELKAQEQHMREQGEQMKGQVQQVMDLEQQVAGLHSKLKEEQKGKAAAVKVSTSTQYPSASTSKVALLAAVTPSYDHRLCHCQSHACIICVITLRRLLH